MRPQQQALLDAQELVLQAREILARAALMWDTDTDQRLRTGYRATAAAAKTLSALRYADRSKAERDADAEHRQDGQDELDRDTAERDWNRALGDGRN